MHIRELVLPGFRVLTGHHLAGEALPRHYHDDPTLCFIVSGRFTEYAKRSSTDCVSGTMKLMPAGEVHWNRFVAEETSGVRIDVDRRRFATSRAIVSSLDEHRVIADAAARGVMLRLVAELQVRDDAATTVVEGLLLEILGFIARERVAVRHGVPAWLRRANDVVHANYTTAITLSGVASSVGVAPGTLARSYRATYQVSIGERVRQLRLEQAARELAESDQSIAAIAANAGFYDQSHFAGLFRRQFAMTPARYRQLRRAPARSRN